MKLEKLILFSNEQLPNDINIGAATFLHPQYGAPQHPPGYQLTITVQLIPCLLLELPSPDHLVEEPQVPNVLGEYLQYDLHRVKRQHTVHPGNVKHDFEDNHMNGH